MLTANRLREVLNYDPETGVFTTLIGRKHSAAGSIAGTRKQCTETLAYTVIGIDRRLYRAHRLAWLYMTGEWPEDVIDHINGDGTDNRWSNIRAASKSQNQFNRRLSKNNATGRKGVYRRSDDKAWVAEIWVNDRKQYLGSFKTFDEAAAVRAAAECQLHGAFSRAA